MLSQPDLEIILGFLVFWDLAKHSEQAEAEVVPSSSSVQFKLESDQNWEAGWVASN